MRVVLLAESSEGEKIAPVANMSSNILKNVVVLEIIINFVYYLWYVTHKDNTFYDK